MREQQIFAVLLLICVSFSRCNNAHDFLREHDLANDKQTNKPILHYFSGRGRAEVSRLIFAEAGVDYEDKRYNEGISSLKPSLPFGQVPYLEANGLKLAQSHAIQRYLAKQYGLYGRNDKEAAIADMIADQVNDIGLAYRDVKTDEEKKKTFAEKKLPGYLGDLEKVLNANGGEYFAGVFTYADLAVYERFDNTIERNFPGVLKNFPALWSHYERVASRPNIAAYIKTRPDSSF